ncbi:MAG: dihydrofolate reductase family protein [Bacteroidetes bacterium]|nr:dihydrofolate reductase family protein [Bacteroidota bacterium]
MFDEYRLCIAPVLLGAGRPLFKQGIESKNLNLLSTQQLSTGGVVLRYVKKDE